MMILVVNIITSNPPRLLTSRKHEGSTTFCKSSSLIRAIDASKRIKKSLKGEIASGGGGSASEMAKVIFMAVFEKNKYHLKGEGMPSSVRKKCVALKQSGGDHYEIPSLGNFSEETRSVYCGDKGSEPIVEIENPTKLTSSMACLVNNTPEGTQNPKNVLQKLRFASTDEVMLYDSILSDSSVQDGEILSETVKSRRSSISDMIVSFSNIANHRENNERFKQGETVALIGTSFIHATNHASKTPHSKEDVDCLSIITYDHSCDGDSVRETALRSSIDNDIRDMKDLLDAIAITKQGKSSISFFGDRSNETSMDNFGRSPIGRRASSALIVSNGYGAKATRPSPNSFSLEFHETCNTTTVMRPFIEKISSILYTN
mmetsp:Transcript_32787/g.66948  ORF Transcript_32787/g.66948 Transcript_32787/m.66948 type:complete len:374 (-) Transcript_32787:26-1147(-)